MSLLEHVPRKHRRCFNQDSEYSAFTQRSQNANTPSQVVIYAFEYETASSPFLAKKASYRTATAPIDITVTNNVIAVTDLMKSVSLVEYTQGRAGLPDTLHEVSRHYETMWGTAIANVADNTYLEADAEGNLIVLQRDVTSYSEDDKRRLRVTSEVLLGEMVNRIRRIDVQPTPNATVIPRAFLATVDGSIYLFALIAPGKQDLLMRMQAKMAEMVKSPGHVPFNKFRGFRSGVRDMGEEGPVRFVDGELVEAFLDMDDEAQEKVVEGLEIGVEEVRGIVESLKRIH
jgi:DNA damage-binding protein 1